MVSSFSNKNTKVFLELLKAGLWEKDVQLKSYSGIDLEAVYNIAEGQSTIGLVAAGLEHVVDVNLQKEHLFPFIRNTLQIETRNTSMNYYIDLLYDEISKAGYNVVLVKGQGIAQCYSRPQWRAAGDIDLLVESSCYNKCLSFLTSMTASIEETWPDIKHASMTFGPWEVELHGTLRSELGRRIDSVIDDVQKDTFSNNNVRYWQNGESCIPIPAPDNDVFFVFVHILQHFFRGGIGLRQICDWCRLVFTFKESIKTDLLTKRLQSAGLLTEWKSFAALAVDFLGMQKDAMPLYSSEKKWQHKALRILSYILETGNFGRNRDISYQHTTSFIVKKTISFWRGTFDSVRHAFIFPLDSIQIWFSKFRLGVKTAARGR